ncbi:hypothetical protein RE432_18445 [Pusillimonas sp. SM2304]|uniref:hypothetical protein n=1 Tax=Pusillimonas sp. SM2304 TaxID=3073241 RepID=UPI00287542F7|nr:hypothetical protein [Pusillimonas sp. SM2304]MDS1142418.1 hypothetical protein [Pusillimonas sp. SM2304]
MSNAIYMIESGKALDLVKHRISEVKRVRQQNIELAKELGAERYRVHIESGVITTVEFADEKHPQFTKPGKYGSAPKKGTEWAKRFSEQKGHESESAVIAEAFDVPLRISYEGENFSGSRCIGYMLRECGFLYLSDDGPYALWIPDVAAEVAAEEGRGGTITWPEQPFSMELEGCRRVEKEEWDILVAQHKLDKKRAAQAA